MDIFWEVHQGLPREAPGDPASVNRALAMMARLPAAPQVLDIACGPGTSTIQLAQLTAGRVIAVDLHTPFLAEAQAKARQAGLADCISLAQMSMMALGFDEHSFDVLWSEGAIYIAGFENGLRDWRRLLKCGGYLALTEATWLKDDPPPEARQFWAQAYPQMQSISGNLEMICRQGYRTVGHFTLPESAWWEGYYTPMAQRIETLRQKYVSAPQALERLEEEQAEIDLYRRYSDWYGYVFYVMEADQGFSSP